jgi:hypothetical protein
MIKETIKMKSFFPLLLIALCGCRAAEPRFIEATRPPSKPPAADVNQTQTKTPSNRPKPEEPRQVEVQTPVAPPTPTAVLRQQDVGVAKIGDYVITREELQQKMMMELRPYDEQYNLIAAPPDARVVLMKMLAEKAMVMEGRRQDYLNKDPVIRDAVKQFKDRNLATLLLHTQLQSKLVVTESEIQEKIKADPNLAPARAKTMLERAKADKVFEQYYSDIYAKFHVKKSSDNLAKAAQIHQRLLSSPKTPRKTGWISNSQIDTDLTPEEKDMVLATYDYGKLTLKDWFGALLEMAPPRRPADLSTPQGVERLLDAALQIPLFVCEAGLLGLEKDESFVKQVKKWEDSHLLNKVRAETVKDINEPTTEQIVEYFNKNKEVFVNRTLKLDQIWCQDLKTAQQVKAELDSGKDFESVRGLYSLEKKGGSFVAYPGSEGIFFQDLWKGEPNQLIGPIKGFYSNTVRWRIVKILEKNPGKVKEYSSDMKDNIKWKMVGERQNALLEKYGKELLEKYPYEIYADRIADIDPLNIP